MAKKFALGLLILAAVAGFAGAQETKIAISLDVFPLTKGIIWSNTDADQIQVALSPSFEILVHPHFTVGGTVDMFFGKVRPNNGGAFYLGMIAHGRYYPMSADFDKFFIDAGLGFDILAINSKTSTGGFAGPVISLKTGYKLKFTRNFFVEPSMSYVYSKTGTTGFPTPIGWQPGLNVGVAF